MTTRSDVKPLIGRPPGFGVKQPVTISLDKDLVAALRATGPGWQTRANDALRKWLDLGKSQSKIDPLLTGVRKRS